MPSSAHGVTTIVMDNCGVGFAPCRLEERQKLIALMEGVEDIPDIVLSNGLPWNWETFPEYLNVLSERSYYIDIAAQLPHSALRVYVTGQRALDGDKATFADLAEMGRLTEEAMPAGAIGFATSRSSNHRSKSGTLIPSRHVARTNCCQSVTP